MTYLEKLDEALRFQNHYAELVKENKKLKAQIEKMKECSKTAYIKGLRTMANAVKKYDREFGAWTDYLENMVNKVLNDLLKEIKEK